MPIKVKELNPYSIIKESLMLDGIEAAASIPRKVNELSASIAEKDLRVVITKAKELQESLKAIEIEYTIRLIQGE